LTIRGGGAVAVSQRTLQGILVSWILWIDRDGFLQFLDRGSQFAAGFQCDPKIAVRIRILRIDRNCRSIFVYRLVETTSRLQRNA
jgi:hypothetical protein